MMTVDWNYGEFAKQIKDTILVTERPAADVVQQQTRLFLKDAVKFTPPTGKSPVNEGMAAQREAGNKAVARDIGRAFVPIEEMNILKNPKDPALAERIEQFRRRGEMEQIQALFNQVGIKNKLVVYPTVEAHNKLRNHRGRVPKSTQQTIVMQGGAVRKFTKEKQELIGTAKSGWRKACEALRVKLPNWIKRHSSPGIYQASLNGPKAVITVGNAVPFIQGTGEELNIINRALSRRTESMRHQMEAMMKRAFSGYGKQRKAQESVSVD